jgi:serine/threonine-protein kinase
MVPTTLNNRYLLDGELGRGGMGVVYRATDLQLHRTVAIKLLPPSLAEDKNMLTRFKNEITNTGNLDNPNMVKVYDMGEVDGAYYYVMELIDGHDLRTEIHNRGHFEVADACEILAQVASALDYAHAKGILHRDIKPENILIERDGGAIRIVDFGIAKVVGATRMTGGMIGTPEYISPEQARGEEADGRSDQYSLAVMAYEMLTGIPPFRTDTQEPWAIVNMHISQEPDDPRKRQKDFPMKAAEALLKALAKRPGERFASCMDFIAALEGKIKFTPRRRSKLPSVQTSVKQRKRSQSLLLVFIMIIALGGGLFFIMRPPEIISNKNRILVDPPPPKVNISISETEGKNFIEKTWLSAWKSGQIGPFSKCYNNDTFIGHNYTARNSYTTLTFDAYLSQWLSVEKSKSASITNLDIKKSDDKHLISTFLLNDGAITNKTRITLEKSSDDSITITHEDTIPKEISIDGLE